MIAAVDSKDAAARDFKVRFGFEEHGTSLEEFLGRPDVGAVIIATSNGTHAPLAVRALHAGKHVMVQKPMATIAADAESMVRAAEESSARLMVSFFELFLPPVVKAKEVIDAGLIGRPHFFKAMMGWYVPEEAEGGWRTDPKMSGGGVIMDGNVHHVANALYLLGDPDVEGVYAEIEASRAAGMPEHTAVIIMRTGGAICEISGSRRALEPGGGAEIFRDNWQVFGTEGTVQWDASERPTLRLFSARADVADKLLGGGWASPRPPLLPEDQREYSLHLNGEESPWVPEHRHFVSSCLGGGPLLSDGAFGLKTQRVIDAAYQSAREGRRAHLQFPG